MNAGDYRLLMAEPTPAGRAAFGRMALPYLAKRETLNNLQLAVLDHVMAGRYPDAIMVAAEDVHGDLAALLLRTPPHPLLVASGCVPAAREALLTWLLTLDPDLPGMVGPLPDTDHAVAWWQERTGRRMPRAMFEGIYRLRSVRAATRAAGQARPVVAADAALVTPWLAAFAAEALGRHDGDARAMWDSYQGDPVRRLYLWHDERGRAVSLAGRSGRTPNGVRIGPVYTPPTLRGRGYAEALVAALSALELAAGARVCYLYTDLANGTSNDLYLRVGYERVGEAGEFRVEAG